MTFVNKPDFFNAKPYGVYQAAGPTFGSALGSLPTGIQSYFSLFVYTKLQKRYVVSTEARAILNSNIRFFFSDLFS